MADDSKLSTIPPLGKSVEEVERDENNQENSPASGEPTGRASFTPITQTNLSTVPNVGGPLAAGLNASAGAHEEPVEGSPRDRDETSSS